VLGHAADRTGRCARAAADVAPSSARPPHPIGRQPTSLSRAWERVLRRADGGVGDLGTWGPEPKREKGKRGRQAERSFTPRFSVYVLRHTMASLNYIDGIDLGLLSRRLGHSNYAFTFDRYGRGVKAENTTAVAENTERRWKAAKGLKLIA
jgi:integrase